MSITRKEVLAIATLARLEVDEEQVASLAEDLNKILDYVQKLDELDTKSVEPTAQVTVEVAPVRADVLRRGLEKKVALEQAPRADEVGFLVPGFVDES